MEPPRDVTELRSRAEALAGRTLGELGRMLGFDMGEGTLRTKGKAGELVERALGASGGSSRVHDFPELAVELKTIPVDERGRPRESTFVCTIALADADRAEWSTSWVRSKLSHVLWVPIVTKERGDTWERQIGTPVFWKPSEEEESVLQSDFDEIMGAIGIGGIEGLTAHVGEWLQVRPKAQTGSARTIVYGAEGEEISTIPRGFYLRTKLTAAILNRA